MKLNLWESVCEDDDLRAEYEAMDRVVKAADEFVQNYDAFLEYDGKVPPWVHIYTKKIKKALASGVT